MVLKVFQLNTYRGFHLDRVIDFVRRNDIDLCLFQEVAGGGYSLNNDFKNQFKTLKEKLDFNGVVVKEINPQKSPQDYFGKATFFRKNIKVLEEKVIWMKNPNSKLEFATVIKQEAPRCALSLKVEVNGQKIYLINTHMAWGPTPFDKIFKRKQADKLINYLKTLKQPFILTGDFNLVPSTEIVKSFGKFARNLTSENNTKFTLNPKIHYLKDDAIKRDLSVDYAFISPQIFLKSFSLITENLSDHYGILLELEVSNETKEPKVTEEKK